MAIIVAAAVIERAGAVLVTRRLEGTHLAGLWEFPGGKCGPLESIHACLIREIAEELGAAVVPRETILVTSHAYPEKTVELHFIACELQGEPVPQQGQEMRWIDRARLDTLEFPEADAALIARLRTK